MELLVWINDKAMNDPNDIGTDLHASSYKAGDVITIQPDGWLWSDDELNNPDWKVISAPILQTHADSLIRPPKDIAGRVLPQRIYRLDIASLGLDSTLTSGKLTGTTGVASDGAVPVSPLVSLSNDDLVAATFQVPGT